MAKYLYTAAYSSGSWARLLRISDDRVKAANLLAESLSGWLDSVYWSVNSRAVYVIADMPDSTMAAAATAVLTQSGAFQQVKADELLNQDQLNSVLEVAGNASDNFKIPGGSLLADDSSNMRFQSRS